MGTFNTILIIFLTAAVGVYFVRQQGFRTFQKISSELENQQIPVQGMFDGLVILIAGILLVTPGFLTDTIGFLGLIPQTRVFLLGIIKNLFLHRYSNVHKQYKKDMDEIIDGDFIEIEEDNEEK